MKWNLQFQQFESEAMARGFNARECSPYHWRIKTVNIWPTQGKIMDDSWKTPVFVSESNRWKQLLPLLQQAGN